MLKTVFYISVTSLLLLLSCKKKDEVGVPTNYTGAKMVSFNNYDGFQSAAIPVADSFIGIDYEVKLANTTSTAGSPITVKLIKDDNAIYEYNTINGTDYSPVPVNAYKFEQTSVTIAKGARTAKIHFEINSARVTSVPSPAFGLSLFSVSGDGAVIHNDEAQTHLVVEIIAVNKYDGIYSAKGYGNLGANTSAPFLFNVPCGNSYEVEVATSGPNSVRMSNQPLWRANALYQGFGNVLPEITFNPSNDQVASVAGYGASTPLSLTAGSNSRYVQATKTIYVSYGFSINTAWLVRDTLTFCRPR
jgi:hypothetical protein